MIADLAEYYNIYDYSSYKLMFVATLVANLREDARVMMKVNKLKVSTEKLILAKLVDNTNLILWSKTKDAEKGKNRPKSLLESLLKDNNNNEEKFTSSKDFEKRRQKLIKEIKGGING